MVMPMGPGWSFISRIGNAGWFSCLLIGHLSAPVAQGGYFRHRLQAACARMWGCRSRWFSRHANRQQSSAILFVLQKRNTLLFQSKQKQNNGCLKDAATS